MSKLFSFQGRKVQILEGQSISVGRSSLRSKLTCQSDNLIFDNAVLSRRHAVLYMADGDIYVKDAASTHGTVYRAPDGTRHSLKPGVPQLLSDKSRLEFGADVLRDSFIHKRLVGTVSLCDSPPSPREPKQFPVSSSETDEEDNFISVYRHKEDETMTEFNYDSPNSSSDQDVLDTCYDNVCVGEAELLESQTPISDIYECETVLNFGTNDHEVLHEQHVASAGLQQPDHFVKSQSLAEKKRDILELMSARRAEKTNAMDEISTNDVPLERLSDSTIVTETPAYHDTVVASHYSELDPVIQIDDETTEPLMSQNNLGHLLVDLDTGHTTAFEAPANPSVSSYAEKQDDSMSDEAPSEYAIFDPSIGRNVWLEAEEDSSPGALESVNDAVGRSIYLAESSDHDWELDEEAGQPLLDVYADQVPSIETSNQLDSGHAEDKLESLDCAKIAGEPQSRLVDDQSNCDLRQSEDLDDSIHLYLRDRCASQAEIVAETMTRKRRASQIDDGSLVHKDKQVKLEASKISWGDSMKRTALGVVIGVGLTFGGLAALGASN